MSGRIASFDFERLEREGFLVLPGLVRPEELAKFERDIAVAGEELAVQRGVERRSDEAIADVLRAAGRGRSMLFDHIKRLFILERLSVEIGVALEAAGLFERAGLAAPIVWPTLRADLPGQSTHGLPLHQDFVTTASILRADGTGQVFRLCRSGRRLVGIQSRFQMGQRAL